MSAIWIEKLRNARSEAERDEILLRELKSLFREETPTVRQYDLHENIKDQMRALSAVAFQTEETVL